MKDNYGPGGFSDQYDNDRMKSMDRDQHPGGVTDTPDFFEDEMDLEVNNFNPSHGEAYAEEELHEPPRSSSGAGTREVEMDNLARSDLRPDLHPHDGHYYAKDVGGLKVKDEKVREDVCRTLQKSHEIKASDFDVTVEDGVVYLHGDFPNTGLKTLAEDLVSSVPGVIDVFTSASEGH